MAAAHARRLVLVVAADIVRLVMERPGQKRPDRVVRAALRARIQPDLGLRQRQPRASADETIRPSVTSQSLNCAVRPKWP